jgi:hypothetical protein
MSSRGWTNISAESISGEARRVIRSKVSGAALLRVLLHRGLGRVFFTFFTFFPFLFDFFFGRWVGREAFRYFPQHFLPDAISSTISCSRYKRHAKPFRFKSIRSMTSNATENHKAVHQQKLSLGKVFAQSIENLFIQPNARRSCSAPASGWPQVATRRPDRGGGKAVKANRWGHRE